ncbi:helix-turn-helix domain-containing protein, partial [Azotobacter beijerinckii]
MKFVSPLSDTDLQALMEAYVHAEKPALRRRAHAIVLSHKRYSINQISDILAVTRETVSLWFDAWEADGLEGLRDKARPGRPAVYDALDRERLQALV